MGSGHKDDRSISWIKILVDKWSCQKKKCYYRINIDKVLSCRECRLQKHDSILRSLYLTYVKSNFKYMYIIFLTVFFLLQVSFQK